MKKKYYLYLLVVLVGFVFLGATLINRDSTGKQEQKPNVVLFFIDDAGFGDFHPFGEPRYPTPHISTLAEEGRSFYNFYVPQAICSASRAALLTGCYPGRTGIFGALGPHRPGLEPQFATLGEVMQNNGYATACFGKWHLGDVDGRRPPSRGFNESCGLMYSNDMWPHHPQNPVSYPPLPYWENGKVTIDTVTEERSKHADHLVHRKSSRFYKQTPV